MTKAKQKKLGSGCSQEVGRELGVCQVNQPRFFQCPPPLRPEAKVNLTPVTLPVLSQTHTCTQRFNCESVRITSVVFHTRLNMKPDVSPLQKLLCMLMSLEWAQKLERVRAPDTDQNCFTLTTLV